VTALRQKVELVEVASVVLARSLDDLAAAAIVNSFAYQAGLVATRDGIAVEKRERNPYTNLIAVRAKDQDAPWAKQLWPPTSPNRCASSSCRNTRAR
jgi:D-methionine transport system substrate-binding protein